MRVSDVGGEGVDYPIVVNPEAKPTKGDSWDGYRRGRQRGGSKKLGLGGLILRLDMEANC